MEFLSKVIFKNSHRSELKKSKKEEFLYFLSFVIVFSFLLAVMSVVSIYVTNKLGEFDQTYAFTNILLLMNFFILFTKSVFESLNVLYFSKDLRILLRMPIKPIRIVHSKLINMIISEYQMETIMLAVPMITYGIKVGAGYLFYLYMIGVLIILPIIPITLVSLITAIIMRFTNMIKNKSKVMYLTVFISIISLGLLTSLFIGDTEDYSVDGFTKVVLQANGLAENISNTFILIKPIMNTLINYESQSGFTNFCIYLVESLICYFGCLFGISALYTKGSIGTQVNTTDKKAKQITDKDFKKIKVVKSYIIKEFKTLLRSPIFCIQCLIMPLVDPFLIMAIVLALINFACSVGFNMWISLAGLTYLSYVYAMFLGIGQVLFMMNFASVVAVSRDAYSAKMLKSIPISLRKQFDLKILFGTLLNMISVILVTAFYYKCSSELGLTIYLGISLFLINLIGEKTKLLIDLSKPQIKWDSEYTLMKQNTNVLYELFYTIVFVIIISIIGFIIDDIEILSKVVAISLFILNYVYSYFIKKNIDKVFSKIL